MSQARSTVSQMNSNSILPANSNSNSNSGHLLHNLLLFGRLLRGLGLDVNPGRMIDLVNALDMIEIGRKQDFYHAARTLLVHKRDDLKLFDEAFHFFWRKPEEGWEINLPSIQQRVRRKPVVKPPDLRAPKPPGEGADEQPDPNRPPIIEMTLTYSPNEVLRQKDFAEMTGEELTAVKQLMAALIWRLGQRRTRRQKPGRGQLLDLRRTMRRIIRHGGEMFHLARREPKYKPRPLVIIADISGSMERYTRLLLQFIYSLSEGLDQRVEAFVFSTRLTRITRQLRGRELDHALREVSRAVQDWSGGTRIGDARKAFNFEWGRRVLGGGAVVVLISDGWDRGEAGVLRGEMARLQRSSHRFIWLNPLLGSPDYEPLTRGMQTALPFIDDFLPVHNLASLEDLADKLANIDDQRAVRRQVRARVES